MCNNKCDDSSNGQSKNKSYYNVIAITALVDS